HRRLSHSLANMASQAVGASSLRWLAEGIACDLILPESADRETAQARLQEAAGRAKKLLLADMDSTMIDQECIDELADEIGVKEHVAAITARSMNGEIAFEPALRERVALLKGLDASVSERIISGRLTLASGG